MTLTLQTIRDHSRCASVWKTLTKAIGSDLTTELSIGDVVISNGINDALWCLQCLEPRVRIAAIMPTVKRASVHTDDKRVHDCIADIDKWLAGDDTVDLKAVARAAGEAGAAEAVSRAAGAAARAAEAAQAAKAAKAVARAAQAAWKARAAEAAARAVARAAAGEAWGAAGTAARAASWAAARKLQRADLLAMFPPMILKVKQP